MCGISGIFDPGAAGEARDLGQLAGAMAATLQHRGPDGSGLWVEPGAAVAFAHNRLAIIDLSAEGHQPMTSSAGRYVITFNGEIYNFQALRRALEGAGCRFRGHSDTEVMLSAIESWGMVAALERFIGMFAFALWDSHRRELHLVRDRVGKKPLYYMHDRRRCAFASELRALARVEGRDRSIDATALSMMLKYSYVPSPHSIYEDVRKVTPGCVVTVRADSQGMLEYQESPYWSVQQALKSASAQPFAGSPTQALTQLDALLQDAVRMRMVSDVPLGAFLSGGIDSSCIVALMQAQSPRPVHTFTIGFEQKEFNEALHASQVARHLGTEHTEMYVGEQQVLATVPELGRVFDEPFADASQIPTLLLSHLTRRHVTVALSGDGGDELFSGYRRYFRWHDVWRVIRLLPPSLRAGLARSASALGAVRSRAVNAAIAALLPRYPGLAPPAQQMQKFAAVLALDSQDAVYEWLVSQWQRPPMQAGVGAGAKLFAHRATKLSVDRYFARMSEIDMQTYLPDDILVKVDRASMAASLEARAPLLDHRVVEFAASLPFDLKVRGGVGKWLLRELAYRYVPRALLDRPKVGFGAPIDAWLRGPLRDWAGDLLSAGSLARSGCIEAEPVRRLWQAHCEQRGNWGAPLWNVLMFQSWYYHNEVSK
jgi:asparagine synthase (glutamine-hydrolysing)